jgi:hypothetical protein
VISITAIEPTILIQNNFMEHRGIRYVIRIGIEREQWRVAIHLPGRGLPEERTVLGTREDAKITARAMINAWLKKRSELKNTSALVEQKSGRRIAVNIAKLPELLGRQARLPEI